jgi:hypothetical protein
LVPVTTIPSQLPFTCLVHGDIHLRTDGCLKVHLWPRPYLGQALLLRFSPVKLIYDRLLLPPCHAMQIPITCSKLLHKPTFSST